MLVLGIDTTTLACGVALASPDRLLAEYTLQVKKTHSERLLPLIAAALRDAGFVPGDLGGVAVTEGPGSFTGVRIGVSTARAIGQALNIPLAGFSTMDVLAAQVPFFAGIVAPILDARRQQVYNALFTKKQRLTPDRALALDQLLSELSGRGDILFIGDGVPVHRAAVISALGERALFLPPETNFNRAGVVARLGLAALLSGQGKNFNELFPRYIRRSEAEVRLQARCCERGGGTEDHN